MWHTISRITLAEAFSIVRCYPPYSSSAHRVTAVDDGSEKKFRNSFALLRVYVRSTFLLRLLLFFREVKSSFYKYLKTSIVRGVLRAFYVAEITTWDAGVWEVFFANPKTTIGADDL